MSGSLQAFEAARSTLTANTITRDIHLLAFHGHRSEPLVAAHSAHCIVIHLQSSDGVVNTYFSMSDLFCLLDLSLRLIFPVQYWL